MKIFIGADIVPTVSNYSLFMAGDAESLVGKELLRALSEADYRVFNLEVPLTDNLRPIKKLGPNLYAPSKTVAGLKALQCDLLVLANNHIMDQGPQGLENTIQTLDENRILHVGAGNNVEQANKPCILNRDGLKLGIYACAEHEFSIATRTKPGANPFDPLECFDHISELHKVCDIVIVLYHGGKEYYQYPSPLLQKTCRKLIEKGANVVISQHSHCIGCEEKYLDGVIIYGQGDFIFDHSDSKLKKESLLIEINATRGNVSVCYHPILRHRNITRFADDENRACILEEFFKRSLEIVPVDFIEKEYARFAQQHLNLYLAAGFPLSHTLLLRAFNRLTRNMLYRFCVSEKNRTAILNYLLCETHRELFIKGLVESRKEDNYQ